VPGTKMVNRTVFRTAQNLRDTVPDSAHGETAAATLL
jgi:hypothetical protein